MDTINEPVTVIISQRVKPGRQVQFEAWVKDIIGVAKTYPGHLGTDVIQPQPCVQPEYVFIFRFDRYENLKTWMTSRDRKYWLAQADPLVNSDPQIRNISGLVAWFSLPGQLLKTPPRYKTALLAWAAVSVLINLLNSLLMPLLLVLPSWIGSLLISGIMTVLLTYVVMPRMTRLFSRWLYRHS